MRLTCPHCQKRYAVPPERAEQLPAQIRCKACGETFDTASARSQETAPETVVVTCSDCGQRYRLPAAKIPAEPTSLPCKACGGSVPLGPEPAAAPAASEPAPEPVDEEEAACADDESSDTPAFHETLSFRLGLAVAVVVLVVAGITLWILHGPRTRVIESRPVDRTPLVERAEPALASTGRTETDAAPDTSDTAEDPAVPEPSLGTPAEPRVGLTLYVPRILEVALQKIQQANDPNLMGPAMMLGMVQSLQLQDAHLLVAQDPEHGMLPVLCVRCVNPAAVETLLTSRPGQALLPQGPGLYALNPAALPADSNQAPPLPREVLAAYRLQFTDAWIVAAPASRLENLVREANDLDDQAVFASLGDAATDRDLFRVGLAGGAALCSLAEQGLAQAVAEVPAGASVDLPPDAVQRLAPLLTRLRRIEALGVSGRITLDGRRVLSVRQTLTPEVDVAALAQALDRGHLEADDPNDMLAQVVNRSVLANAAWQRTVTRDGQRLGLDLAWPAEQDQAVLGHLVMTALMPSLGGGPGMTPPPAGAPPR